MNVTNRLDLPKELVDIIKSNQYERPAKRYSVTEILNPVRQIILSRYYYNSISTDVSDSIYALWGSGVHKIFEDTKQDNIIREFKLSIPISLKHTTYELSGIIDKIDLKNKTIVDYKTTSKYSVKQEDWINKGEVQMMIYAYMLKQLGIDIQYIELDTYLRDWHQSDKNKGWESNIVIHKTNVNELKLATICKQYVVDKFNQIYKFDVALDEQVSKQMRASTLVGLPLCDAEDRWHKPDSYAVKYPGLKKALRVLDTEEEAEKYIHNYKGEKYSKDKMDIEFRPGEDSKCLNYCNCNQFCTHYQNIMNGVYDE